MNSWKTWDLELKPHAPEILASTGEARAIVLLIPAGESLDDHEVHERAWLTVLGGEVEITANSGESISGGCGLFVEFAPSERHAIRAPLRRSVAAAPDSVAGSRPPRSDDPRAEDQRPPERRGPRAAHMTAVSA